MCSHLPLDDQLNRLFYTDGALYRLVYSSPLGRCVLRREVVDIQFYHVVTLITSGEVLWSPPETFDRLDANASIDAVRAEHALLCAFLRSPVGHRLTHKGVRSRLETRLNADRAWLVRHAFSRRDADEPTDDE